MIGQPHKFEQLIGVNRIVVVRGEQVQRFGGAHTGGDTA